jgi:hypothetical protein
MGKNGHDGKNGKGLTLIPFVDQANLSFEPSERQEAFRDVAYRLCEENNYFKGDWFKETREMRDEFPGDPVRLREWKEWLKNHAFVAWFYAELPIQEPPDEYELNAMDGQWWHGIDRGLKSNKEWAYKAYARQRWGDGGQKAAQREASELEKYLGSENEADKWRQPVPEA